MKKSPDEVLAAAEAATDREEKRRLLDSLAKCGHCSCGGGQGELGPCFLRPEASLKQAVHAYLSPKKENHERIVHNTAKPKN